MNGEPSKAQAEALTWLVARGGEGGFLKWPSHHVLLAGGDTARVMFTTWKTLEKRGLVEKIPHRRLKVTEAGYTYVATLLLSVLP